MTESELKEALKKYQEAKLKEIDEMVDQMEEHEFSRRFQRRIKKLFWCERYFGSRITLGLVMRKVAMIAIILTSLVVAGQVSAGIGAPVTAERHNKRLVSIYLHIASTSAIICLVVKPRRSIAPDMQATVQAPQPWHTASLTTATRRSLVVRSGMRNSLSW